VYHHRNLSCLRAEERLADGVSHRPLRNHVLAVYEDRFGSEHRVGIKFSRLLEEFRQPLLAVELYSNPVVGEADS